MSCTRLWHKRCGYTAMTAVHGRPEFLSRPSREPCSLPLWPLHRFAACFSGTLEANFVAFWTGAEEVG